MARGVAGAYHNRMAAILPESREFETPVYGTVFAERSSALGRLQVGDALILVPDPEGVVQPSVWVHAPGGDVVGHLAPHLNRWMVPRMLVGTRYSARVLSIGGTGTESWKRLIIVVTVHDLPRQRAEAGHSDDLE